jgi:hypothetical protein
VAELSGIPGAKADVPVGLRPGTEAGGRAALRVRLALPAGGGDFSWETEVQLERATARRDFAAILTEVFAESGDCLLTVARLELANRTGLPDDALFAPPSALKKARVAFYRALSEALEVRRAGRLQAVAEDRAEPKTSQAASGRPQAATAPALLRRAARRQDLAPLHENGDPAPHPFADARARVEELAEAEGFRFLPLAPVARAEDPAGWVGRLLDAHPEERFAVGLSNLAHLELARTVADRPNAFFFADFHLYAANRFTVAFLARQVPRLLYVTHWLEGSEEDARALGAAARHPLLRLAAGFRPPLFYGLGCPRGQGVLRVGGRTGCRDCPRGFDVALTQGKNRFRLSVRDCTAYLYAAP